MASTSVVFDIIGRDRASSEFNKVGNSADGSGKKVGKLGSMMKTVGKIALVGLGAGLVFGAKALVDMTRGAIEDEKAQAILARTLRNAAGATDEQIAATEDWITVQGKALGVTDDELRPALQRLTEATGDVGKAQKLASLAMDISAGTGKSLKTVSEALAKAQMGQVGGLSRYGIATRNAAGEMMSFDDVVKKASVTFKGQASESANTLEGKMSRLKLMFDETKETIGAKLIPTVTKLADWFLADGIPMISRFAGVLQDVGGKLVATGRFVNDHRVALGALAGTIAAVVAVTKIHSAVMAVQAAGGMVAYLKGTKLITTATKVWTAVQWAMNAALAANPLVLVIGLVVDLGVALVVAYKKSETFRNIVTVAMNNVKAAIKAVGDMGRWMWNNALQPVFKFIVDAVGKVLQWFGKMLQLIGKAPKMGWVGDLGDKLVNAGDKATGLADKIDKIPDSKTFTLKFNVAHGPGAGAALGLALAGGNGRIAVPSGASGRMVAGSTVETSLPLTGPNARVVGGGGDSRPIVVQLVADGRVWEQVLIKHTRTTGRPLQVRTLGPA